MESVLLRTHEGSQHTAASQSQDWGSSGWGWGCSTRKRTSELGTSDTGGGREVGVDMLLAQNREEMGVIVAEQVSGSLRSPDKAPTLPTEGAGIPSPRRTPGP